MSLTGGLRGALGRRLLATARVWRAGAGHMAMLAEPHPPPEPEPPRRSPPAAGFDLELADAPVPRGAVNIRGWAVSQAGPCSRVDLTVSGHAVGPARLGELRPDIEVLLDFPPAALSGFNHLVNLALIPGLGEEAELGGSAVGLDGTRFDLPRVRIAVEPPEPALDIPPPARFVPRPGFHPSGSNGSKGRRDLRLLVCTHELGWGGAQLFLAELLRQIAELGPLSGLVISPSDGPTRPVLEELGFRVHVTPPAPLDSLPAYDARLEELAAWVGDGFDVALVNTMGSFPGADVALRLGLPVVWAIHESLPLPEYWALSVQRLDPGVRERAEAALSQATLAFTCDATRACYEASLATLRCVTLPYGIDVDALDEWRQGFDRAAARREAAIDEDQTVVLCLGTIEPRKAQTQLIHAFARVADQHPRAVLELVGSRGDHHAEEARAAVRLHGLEDRVRIEPVLPDVRPSYAMADVLVCASDIESTPRSILEAMALGLPVLSTDVFGVPELISNGESGWLCPSRDVSALADALDLVLRLDADERARVAARARATVEADYRSELCSRAWAEALRALSATPGRAQARTS